MNQLNTADNADIEPAMPPALRNGLRGPGQQALDSMVGHWNVHKATYVAGGTPDKPLEGDITSDIHWIEGSDQRFLQETTSGMLNGMPYFREGLLGYSNMDKRYEWTTVDSINSMQMKYVGAEVGAPGDQISMTGSFTDQGVLGDESIGKRVAMRFVITRDLPDQMIFELYFTPDGGAELLADKAIYSRQ